MVNNSTSIVNVLKKQLHDYGDTIGVSKDTKQTPYLTTKALAQFNRQKYQADDFFIYVKDAYKFIMLEKPTVFEYIQWKNGLYQITSIDNTVDGIYKCICSYVGEVTSNTYKIKVTPSDTGNITINNTVQLSVKLYENDVEIADISNYTFTYESTNKDIATVDNTGLVTAIGVGSTTITVSLDGYENVTDIYTITVVKEEVVLSIVGDDVINSTGYYEYYLSDHRDGLTWELDSDGLDILDTYFNSYTDSCELYVSGMVPSGTYTITITAKNEDDNTVLATKTVTLNME